MQQKYVNRTEKHLYLMKDKEWTTKLKYFCKKDIKMKRKYARANYGFLLGSFIFIIVLFITVFLFLFWAPKAFEKTEIQTAYQEKYEISLDETTLHKPLILYVNDSMIFNGIPNAIITLSIGRFAEECSILAVDGESEKVSVIQLPEQSSKVTIIREGTDYIGKLE